MVSFFSVGFLALDYSGKLGNTVEYNRSDASKATLVESEGDIEGATATGTTNTVIKPEPVVEHIKTPSVVKAFYMTSCIASGVSLRSPMLGIIDRTEINSIVIDVKDYTGYVSVDFGNPDYPIGGKSCLVRDMKEFVAYLHSKGIYTIARIAVMQDPYYAEKHPDQAVKRKDNGGVWKDKKGLAFVDPSYKEFWDYNKNIAIDSYKIGFDEVNFDYVRYPTDGSLSNMSFKLGASSTKASVMKDFYVYMGGAMKEKGIPSSVDIFGMTTTAKDDLGIGQVIEDALVSFDYVAPMVYPSHYPKNFNGWKDPNMFPGPLTEFVMGESVNRAVAIGLSANKLRTWVQDFDYGKDYTATDIRAIIEASRKVGVNSYMVWDPSNKYTEAAYGKKEVVKINPEEIKPIN